MIADDDAHMGEASAHIPPVAPGGERAELSLPFRKRFTSYGKPALVAVWLSVTSLLLLWTLIRALRFRHWLARASLPAPGELRDEVSEIGRSLELAWLPEVRTTTAHMSPMVCWIGGRVRLVIPSLLVSVLGRQERRAVLAHELAHVRRRDYVVRWIEWLACSAFWWNPVAWWARRQLRAAEEASCDALGVTALKCAPRDYAKSLLRVVELLSRPPTPPIPAFASGAVRSRNPKDLERRFKMLVSAKSIAHPPRWIRKAGTAAAFCLLPLGLVYCGFADQPIPTGLDDATESPSVADFEAPERIQPAIKETRYLNVEGPPTVAAEDGPVLAYMILTANETIGPHALATAPGLPQECRLDPISIEACSSAMKADVKSAADSQAWGVCVGDLVPNSWQGKCRTWDTSPFRLFPVFAEILRVDPVPNANRESGGSML